MTIAWAIARWFGWKAGAFALCALLLGLTAWWHSQKADSLRDDVRVLAAEKAALEAQVSAAQAIAKDYEARAAASEAAEKAERAARKAEATARERKWARIKADEKQWADTPLPESVVEGLR